MYFTDIERAVLRNLAEWSMGDEDGWITLPESAHWWPSDYDMEEHGFVPDASRDQAKDAYDLIPTVLTCDNYVEVLT